MRTSSTSPSFDLNLLPESDVLINNLHSPSPENHRIDLNRFPTDVNSFTTTTTMSENTHPGNKKKNITPEMKRAVFAMLVEESCHGNLARGVVSKVANHFSISRRSVDRIWRNAKNFSIVDSENVQEFFCSKLVNRVGRKRVEVNLERVKDIPFRRRTNIRSLSIAIGASKSTVHRRIKEGYIRPHSNPVKPYLTDENKKARLEFCLSMIDPGTRAFNPSFFNMHNQIHIDEKWFYMTKTTKKYYLHPDESKPYRTCKSKRFITKIMFLAAVARPRFDANTNTQFNGKIGIWPFVFKEAAKRKSKNRVAGTLETKPILSVTKEIIRSCLIEKVLPAIKGKWPASSSKTIFIQQDNAKPHLGSNDPDFVAVAREDGFHICLCCQPPNSPDLNVLDLGFFRAIDTLQHQEAPSTIDEFISAVEKAYDIFPVEDLNNVFLTLQSCMVEVLRNSGGNKYKIPHMNKKRLTRNEQLPDCITCDSHILDQAEEAVKDGN